MLSANSTALATSLLLLSFAVLAEERLPTVRLLVQSSPLAGFRYYAAAEVWRELRVGDRLELLRDAHNPHDANAVAVLWRGRKLGYVPRRDNAALAWGLDRGERIEARISRITEYRNRARRLQIEVFVD